jgi:hypothetical protein
MKKKLFKIILAATLCACMISIGCVNAFATMWYKDGNEYPDNIRYRGYAYTYYPGYIRLASDGARFDKIDSGSSATYNYLYLQAIVSAENGYGEVDSINTGYEGCSIGVDYVNTGNLVLEDSDNVNRIITQSFFYYYSGGFYNFVIAENMDLSEAQIAAG